MQDPRKDPAELPEWMQQLLKGEVPKDLPPHVVVDPKLQPPPQAPSTDKK